MKKKLSKKLELNRETIRALSDSLLELPAGGATNGANYTCNFRACVDETIYC